MPNLIKNGHLYLAVPPLYKLTISNQIYYVRHDIEIDKLMSSITSKVPGLDKMMKGFGSEDGSVNIKDMMNGFTSNEKKEKVLIDENFSTSNIPVAVIEEKPNNGIKIGNILKIADQFGVLPGNKKSETENKGNTDESLNLEGMPNLGKIMEIMQKLDKSSTPNDADNLKNEMNTFLKNDLGIDMNNFTQQLEEMTKKLSEPIIDQNDNLD
jgi:hypothetical protein